MKFSKALLYTIPVLLWPAYAFACSLRDTVFLLSLKLNTEVLTAPDSSFEEKVLTLSTAGGERVGTLSYRYYWQTARISLDNMDVAAAYRGRYVGDALFTEMLKDHTDVTIIESTLMKDNYPETGEHAEEIDTSDPAVCAASIMSTPAMRMRIAHGFTRISNCERLSSGAGILLVVARSL